jgi:hypothetical protein
MRPMHPCEYLMWYVSIDGSTVAGFTSRRLAVEYIANLETLPKHKEVAITHVDPPTL